MWWQVKAASYMQLTFCLLGSSYLSTVGLDYINYPTKVVFRSCKLIPTMAVALVMNKERFSVTDITCAVAICAGLALFALADMTSVSKVSTVFGMALQASSTVADAFLPNLQQALFKQGASTLEVTYYTNLYVFFIMTLMGGGSGHLQGAWTFARTSAANAMVLLFYSVVAYWAINFHIRVVQRYGSVVAVLVGNLRKAGTIALSFLVFPKPFSWFYVAGTLLVFGGLTITAYVKDQKRRSSAPPAPRAAAHAVPSDERGPRLFRHACRFVGHVARA
jgi:adenosine 3'-phospho 5'-phosphosulfate transporter B3